MYIYEELKKNNETNNVCIYMPIFLTRVYMPIFAMQMIFILNLFCVKRVSFGSLALSTLALMFS